VSTDSRDHLVRSLRDAALHRPDLLGALLAAHGEAPFASALARLPGNLIADTLSILPGTDRRRILARLFPDTPDKKAAAKAYPEDGAGSIMTAHYVTLGRDLTARQAVDSLRRQAPEKETIYHAYVVDDARKLVGVVSLRELIVADESALVADIMRRQVIVGYVDDSKETIAEKIARHDVLALPIVGADGKMAGIVTVDEALDEAIAKRSRDVAQFGGNVPIGGGPDLSFRSSSFAQLFSTRAFWLAILTVFGVVTSTFVAAQEEMLSEIIILAAFIAPIIDAGGNTGSQSATLIIRSMALGEVNMRWRDLWFVVRRELPVVLALGVTIGVLEAVLAFFSKGVGLSVLLVVGLSMGLCMILGGLIGALLPFAAKRIGADPATLSAPLITSIMDLLGVLVYFGLAYFFMGHMLTAA